MLNVTEDEMRYALAQKWFVDDSAYTIGLKLLFFIYILKDV